MQKFRLRSYFAAAELLEKCPFFALNSFLVACKTANFHCHWLTLENFDYTLEVRRLIGLQLCLKAVSHICNFVKALSF